MLLTAIIFWVLPILVSYSIGARKGLTYGWAWGFVLGWIGVIIVALRSPKATLA